MAHRSVRRGLGASIGALLGLAVAVFLPALGGAQTPPHQSQARLQGVVVDESTGQPVDSATVTVDGTALTVTTGRWGSFEFPDAPLGPASVHVRASGHPSVVQEVDVRDGRVAFLRVVLPSVAAFLDEILVRGQRQRGATDAARTAADLLALRVPRTRVSSGMVGESNVQIRLRQAASFQGSTAPSILIDGVAVSGASAFEALDRIPAADVEDIEVLSGPAAAFLHPYAANGVILVRTKRGAQPR
ncbi:MAG: carboxypeptidase regulatory-like domain-containing protein [Gemmatimonadota bacterium]